MRQIAACVWFIFFVWSFDQSYTVEQVQAFDVWTDFTVMFVMLVPAMWFMYGGKGDD